VARLAVERGREHGHERQEAGQGRRPHPPHERVQLAHRDGAQGEQAERPDLTALVDEDQRDDDRRDRHDKAWHEVRPSPLPPRRHPLAPPEAAPARGVLVERGLESVA
jgi:hypothetical protein